MNFNEFHSALGQAVMYCQIIEHDVKAIYAAMAKGDYKKNLADVQKMTLGQAVQELRELDRSGGYNRLSEDDYGYLLQIAGCRNHWCHEAYVTFAYEKNFLQGSAYKRECERLENDKQTLAAVYKVVEKVKIAVMRDFGRV